MGIWVRSQDKKELINVNAFFIRDNDMVKIYAKANMESSYLIGEYETEGRAIQVLDQIQQRLIVGYRNDIISNCTRVYRETVFEMPEQ